MATKFLAPVYCLLAAFSVTAIGETITFDFDDDFATPLVNGQMVDSPMAFGNVFTLSSSGPNLGAAIFDSDPSGPNSGALDQDLLVDMTNLLMLQSSSSPGAAGGIFSLPNDSDDGGLLTFDFAPAGSVELTSIDVVDVDANPGNSMVFTLTDGLGLNRQITVPRNYTGDISDGQPGSATIDFASGPQESPNVAGLFTTIAQEAGFSVSNVVLLTVQINGSGALDNLVFVPEPGTGLLLGLGLVGLMRRRSVH